jgi:Holliday junction DNA helicase RuvB
MLARFGIQSRLEYYTIELLGMIIERSARVLGVPIYEDAA